MALISGVYDDEPRNSNSNAAPRVQKYWEYLASTTRGAPGKPRTPSCAPCSGCEVCYESMDGTSPYREFPDPGLIDGPVVAPAPPPKPPRKRSKRRPVPEDFPTGDRDLKLLARKLTGRD